jgi:hypothetical protein
MAISYKTVKTIRHGFVAAAALGVLGACGTNPAQQQAAAPPPSPVPTSTVASGPSSDVAQAPSPAANSVAQTGPKICKAGDLSLAIVAGDGAGMNQNRVNLQFTNKSSENCALQGSPGVSFVTGDSGQQVGVPATREEKSKGTLVTISPGSNAKAPLTIVNAGVFDPAQCAATDARGLRVYAPDDTASMFVDAPQQACTTLDRPQLSVGVVA